MLTNVFLNKIKYPRKKGKINKCNEYSKFSAQH